MKNKIIISGIVVFLILMVVGCSFAEQKHFKGYGIETWTNGSELTIKAGNSKSSVIILPKKFSKEESFAFHCWNNILSVYLTEDMEINDKIKAVEEIQRFIKVLAIQVKTGEMEIKEDVSIEINDIKKALETFWKMSFVAADRIVGNWDEFCSDAEIHKLKISLQSRVVAVITKTYFE